MTPIHAADFNDDAEALKQLVAEGVSPDLRDKHGYTALLWASFSAAVTDQVPVIKMLIGAGADPNAITGAGDSNCLMLAAQSGCEAAVAELVAGGANVDASANGVTALMVAARMGEKAVATLLLQLGANPSVKAGSYTAADYARYGGHDELADILENAIHEPRMTTPSPLTPPPMTATHRSPVPLPRSPGGGRSG